MSERRFPWRTLLFVSLALNFLTIGVIVGGYGAGVRLERAASQAVVGRMPGPRAFLQALPPETRAKMRAELAQSWQASREARQAALQARRDAFAAAATEPYDAVRVKAAFERLRAADQAAIGVFHDTIADAFARLSPEERAEALQALREATPARRRAIGAPREDGAQADGEREKLGPALTPEERRLRRQQRRERMRDQLEQEQQSP